jgi:uncharacterized membrane protein YcaP (DUF421 family)
MSAVFRAAFGYLFLVLMVRVVGRRPGNQMAPFDYILIFFIGGLTLTGMVSNDRSITNAVVQVVTVAAVHYILTRLRRRWPAFGRVLDGAPVILLMDRQWRTEALEKLRISRDEVMAAAREQGVPTFQGVEYAVLERNGAISILPFGATPKMDR